MRKIFRPLAAQVLGLRSQLGKTAFSSRRKGRSSICAHHSAVLKGHFALSVNIRGRDDYNNNLSEVVKHRTGIADRALIEH